MPDFLPAVEMMGDAENLTKHPRGDFRPAFSSDGRKVAFSSDRDSDINSLGPIGRIRDGDIYVLDLIGKQVQRLTHTAGWDGSPTFSPDGKTIAFYSQRDTASERRLTVSGVNSWARPEARIWAMNTDESSPRLVTPDEMLALSPKFLKDSRIVYSRKTKEGLWQIVSIHLDGSAQKIASTVI